MNKLSSYLIVDLPYSRCECRVVVICSSVRSEEDLGRIIEILVFYFICNYMVITQIYGLIWKWFSEEIIAGIDRLKTAQKYPGLSINVTAKSWHIGVWVNFPEILLFVTLLLNNFVMFSCKWS